MANQSTLNALTRASIEAVLKLLDYQGKFQS